MSQNKAESKTIDAPTDNVKENPESKIKRLEQENAQLRQLAESTVKENQILRATVKAMSQLL